METGKIELGGKTKYVYNTEEVVKALREIKDVIEEGFYGRVGMLDSDGVIAKLQKILEKR